MSFSNWLQPDAISGANTPGLVQTPVATQSSSTVTQINTALTTVISSANIGSTAVTATTVSTALAAVISALTTANVNSISIAGSEPLGALATAEAAALRGVKTQYNLPYIEEALDKLQCMLRALNTGSGSRQQF